jgi:two-component system, NarL family, sensor kinase
MFLSKEEFILLIAIASGVPIILIGFVAALLFRQNNQRKMKQIEIRDAMLSTQENERKRIARDLHDHIGPLLTGIKLEISFDSNTLSEKQTRNLEKAKKDCDLTIQEIRSISHDLYSSNITSIGLIASLQETIKSLSNDTFIFNLNFSIDDSKLSYDFQINLYRICLELINNSIKHSSGNAIFLSLTDTNRVIHLEYNDNGISQAHQESIGIGLQNLKNRIKLLNGEIIDFSEDFSEGAKFKFLFNSFR